MPCALFLSSLPFPTIAYPLVCWGGGLIHYQGGAADWEQRPLVPRSRCSQRLTPGVRLHSYGKKQVGMRLTQGDNHVVQCCRGHRDTRPESARGAACHSRTVSRESVLDRPP